MKEHCAQCLQVVYANGHQTPDDSTLCRACHAALWGPESTDSLRELVTRHSDSRHAFRPRPVLNPR